MPDVVEMENYGPSGNVHVRPAAVKCSLRRGHESFVALTKPLCSFYDQNLLVDQKPFDIGRLELPRLPANPDRGRDDSFPRILLKKHITKE